MISAREAGWIACRACGRLSPLSDEGRPCPVCGGALHSRRPRSLQASAAWLIVGIMAYVPANLYPIMTTSTLGRVENSTILGGVSLLWRHGAWDLAIIVFVASIVTPIAKFLAVGGMIVDLALDQPADPHGRHRLHAVIEYIGRWSMLDVFVVAILAALVQIGATASIHPGPAAAAFGLSVAFTMLAAQSLDQRLIWDAPTARKGPS